MTLASRTTLSLAGALAVLALGCQADDGDDADLLAQEAASAPDIDGGRTLIDAAVALDAGAPDAARPDAGKPRPDPNRPFFASVTAHGTGCPAGSWGADISSDGTRFKVYFAKYEATVEDGQRISFKDCNLTVELHSPTGIAYAVTGAYYQGYAFLEQGVRGFQTANYYFQGNPVPSASKEKRTDLTGPVDRSYLFQDTVTTADVVWSPCGLDRKLQVVTRIGLQKSQNEGAGYINVEKFLGFDLSWKKC